MNNSGKATIFFATDNSVSNEDYVGLGVSSSNLLRNTVVIPYDCTATVMAFSIRELSNSTSYTATLIKNGVASSLVATIVNGAASTGVVVTGGVSLSPLDLVTIQVTWSGGALSRGVCISLTTVY